jgi:hypothetical protein
MSKPARIWSRTARLETHRSHTAARRLAERIGEEVGFTAEEVLREAQSLTRRWQELGAYTHEAQCAHLAVELGLSIDEVHAELAAIRERCA